MINHLDLQPVAEKISPADWRSIRIRFARLERDVPELQVEGWAISEAERRELQRELNLNYSTLLSNIKNGRSQIRFRTTIQGIPPDADFRGALLGDKANARTDGLIFSPAKLPEPVVSKAEDINSAMPATPKHWSGAFVSEAAGFLAPERLRSLKDRYQSHALQACLEELEALQRTQPEAFGILLLAGYLSLGESLARRHDPDRASLYLFANRGFEVLLESSSGNGERQESLETEAGFRELIPRACRCIARLFGFVKETR